ncbi:signal peptidase I [Nocardioides litoris]|uniref:signal peptidase I n=1 Tax=Nocardioides litoris TaxID=1926648 RepID=UPI001B882530|nr:signal peptidase I [Nocardioides litoris]
MVSRLRELVLWVGAALGLLAVVTALAVALGGFSFLVFRSGSMAPEIPTGGLALARTVDASDLRPGDVVSVTAASGERITHRVQSTTLRGDQASLVLKGDANNTADSEVYVVTSAERVIASMPYGGYVVAHLLTPPGLVALGALSAMLLLLTSGRQKDRAPAVPRGGRHADTGTRRRRRRAATVLVAGSVATAAVIGTSGTLATFTDRATAATSTSTSGSIAVPAQPDVITQTTGTGAAPISWAPVKTGDTGAMTYDIVRYTQATGGTGTVMCQDVTSPLSCTEPKPATAAANTTYYYGVRARYGANWTSESTTRRAYTPDVISPGGNYQTPVLTSCTNTQLACGTASDSGGGTVARVEFSLLRVRTLILNLSATAQCWNGSAYVGATNGACPTFQLATGTTSWSVPGSKSTAYAPAPVGYSQDFTLIIRLVDSYGNVRTSSPIEY